MTNSKSQVTQPCRRNRRQTCIPSRTITWNILGTTCVVVGCLVLGTDASAQEREAAASPEAANAQGRQTQQGQQTPRRGESATDRTGAATSRMNDEHAYDESPALGVIVSTCPGDAVCVHGTIWGSPAQEADIRDGDYILKVNETPVTSPKQLQEVIRQSDREAKTKLVLWRQGTELNKEVDLANEAKELPKGQSAWLGVQLTDGDEGIALARVVRGSPADEAGLEERDIVVSMNGEEVRDVASFVERIADLGPGSNLELVVRRGSQQRSMTAQLGTIDDAPLAFLRHAFSEPQWEGQSATTQQPDEVIDATVDALRREVRQLRQQVDQLSEGDDAARTRDGAQRIRNRSEDGESIDDSDSGAQLDLNADGQTRFVLQQRRNQRDRSWDNRNRGSRSWYDNYRRNYRYTYPPIYRSPYYGNSYYRQGGRYYYYGNRNVNRYPYGYGYGRSGLRFGLNLGNFWY